MINRVAKKPSKQIKYWVNGFNNAVKAQYRQQRLTQSDLPAIIKASALITLLEDKKQQVRLFWAMSFFILGTKKVLWPGVIEALPKTQSELIHFSECVRKYETLAQDGHFQSLKKGKFNPVSVIEIIVRLGDNYNAYLELYKDSFYTYPAKVFSEGLVKEAGKKLKGTFGAFSKQRSDFAQEIDVSTPSYDG